MTPIWGMLQLFAFNWAPTGYSTCQGQQLLMKTNQAIFSLIGNTYGGDGITVFNLPNLAGRTIWGMNQGAPNNTKGGAEFETLSLANLPAHTHSATVSMPANNDPALADTNDPTNAYPSAYAAGNCFSDANPTQLFMAAPTVAMGSTGGAPIDSRSPFLVLNYCIALSGAFPQRP